MGVTLRAADLRDLSQGERFLVFFFAVLPGNHTVACVATYAQAATGRPVAMLALQSTVDGLVTAGILEDGVVARGGAGPAYRLAATFTLKGLRMLAEDALRHGWWPTPDVLNIGLAGSWLGMELAYGVRNFVTAAHVWQVSEAMRGLLCGGDCGAYGLPAGAGHSPASVHWAAVGRLLELVQGEPFAPVEDLSPRALALALPTLLEDTFVNGRDVRPTLEIARGLLQTPKLRIASSFFCTYAALCVWTGRRDLLNGLAGAVPRESPAEAFAALCTDLFEGRFEAAEKAFASGADSFRGVFPGDVSTPVWALGVALALREDAPLTRTAKYAKELQSEPADVTHWHPAARSALREAQRLRTALVESLMSAGSTNWRPQLQRRAPGDDPLASAREAFRQGYPTLAAVHVAAFRRVHPDASRADELEDLLSKNRSVPIVKGVMREPVWKTALREISECLPAQAAGGRGEQILNGSVGWLVSFSTMAAEDGPLYACERVCPVYRGPRGAEDGSDDRRLTVKGLNAAKYQACLTSQDNNVLGILQKNGYNPRVVYSVPDEALEFLCGHTRLLECASGSEMKDGEGVRRPVTLERRTCELTTERGAAGEMRLVLPAWLFSVEGRTHAIRREGDTRYLYYPLPKRIRDIVDVFRTRGTGGVIEIPTDGLGEAKDVLERLAGEMSVAGAFAVGNGGFARVPGDPTPCVRIVYANDALALSLVVSPLPNRAVAACEPGVGLPERLVQVRGGKTVLLTRDFAAEEAAAEKVRAALAPFDAWATAKNRWLVKAAEEALDALRALMSLEGVRLEWPEGRKMRVASAGGVSIEASGEDWFRVDGEVRLDDGRVMALMEVLRALANREGNYVRFGEGEYVYLSNELLRRMEALAVACGPIGATATSAEVPDAAVPMLAKAFEDDGADLPQLPALMAKRAERIREVFGETVDVPRRFKGSLRPYQTTGYTWLAHLAACGFGACLADDMGLGKTVQVIALLLKRAAEGPSLVVAPASVCVNWLREIERFAPSLHPVTLWGGRTLPEKVGKGDVVVASYGLLVSRAEDFERIAWNGVVLDEAQAVKNAATQRAHVAKALRANFRVAATGTPVENRLAEFWSIFSFLNPRLLGTQKEFEARFTEAGFATAPLKRLVEPFVLRRLKRDVLKELPEKTEITLRIGLGEEERAAYEACRKDSLAALKANGRMEHHASILAALSRLRRFCCHPSLVYPDQSRSAKLDAVLELLEELREAGHRALVFSQFTDYLAIVRAAVEGRGWTYRYLDGSTPSAERAEAVDAFQRGEGDFFLISLKAGGVGLNLTAANFVLLLDPWWNPAVEDQAADRAHRIGQKLPVTVYRIVAADTVEERILDLHGDKRAVSEDLLESAHGVPLTSERLLALFE